MRQYKKYKLASGKTAKSILISCGARLAPFDIPQLREIMSYDELELDRMGDRKTAAVLSVSATRTPPTIFLWPWPFRRCSTSCVNGRTMFTAGRLPHHVRVLWDEAANTGQVPELEKLVAVIRSREISLCLFYQQLCANARPFTKDNAETILGNMDSVRVPRRAGKLHHQGNFRELAGQGHHLHADRGALPWAVRKLQPEHPAARAGS